MLKNILALGCVTLILVAGSPAGSNGGTDPAAPENRDLSSLEFERIAVMPFGVGKLESPDDPVEKPLSQSLQELKSGTVNVVDGAEQILTRLAHNYLQVRYREQLVSLETAAMVSAQVLRDTTLDTPRKLAVRFGQDVKADLVIIGFVWRFREKGANMAGQESPSSVAFSVYLVAVDSGQRLWRGAFDGTQKVLSEDVLGGLKQVKLGLRWLSATDLARLGVKQAFQKFPLR